MGLLVEVMVSVLLAVTIWYCVMLDRRLKRFKEDEESFRKLIGDLTAASLRAEATVPGLRVATAEAEQGLGESLKRAEEAMASLQRRTEDGEDVLRRIAQIIAANRAAENTAQAGPVPTAEDNVTTLSANRIERLSDAARAARELAVKARDRKMAGSRLMATAPATPNAEKQQADIRARVHADAAAGHRMSSRAARW